VLLQIKERLKARHVAVLLAFLVGSTCLMTRNVPRAYAAEPPTIRVYRSRLPDPVVETVDFQEYLRVVLPEEWVAEWQNEDGTPESLRAGAIAVRTFGWYYVLNPQCEIVNPPECPFEYDLTDTSQTYIPDDPRANHPNTNRAITDTLGLHVTYNSEVAWARYSRENGNPTLANATYAPPLSAVLNPICNQDGLPPERDGHGEGVCQLGSRRWARGTNDAEEVFPQWDNRRILAHYYTGIHLRDADDNVLTPDRRWNMLEHDIPTSMTAS